MLKPFPIRLKMADGTKRKTGIAFGQSHEFLIPTSLPISQIWCRLTMEQLGTAPNAVAPGGRSNLIRRLQVSSSTPSDTYVDANGADLVTLFLNENDTWDADSVTAQGLAANANTAFKMTVPVNLCDPRLVGAAWLHNLFPAHTFSAANAPKVTVDIASNAEFDTGTTAAVLGTTAPSNHLEVWAMAWILPESTHNRIMANGGYIRNEITGTDSGLVLTANPSNFEFDLGNKGRLQQLILRGATSATAAGDISADAVNDEWEIKQGTQSIGGAITLESLRIINETSRSAVGGAAGNLPGVYCWDYLTGGKVTDVNQQAGTLNLEAGANVQTILKGRVAGGAAVKARVVKRIVSGAALNNFVV